MYPQYITYSVHFVGLFLYLGLDAANCRNFATVAPLLDSKMQICVIFRCCSKKSV